jgi:hypothetical protein
MLRPSSSRPIAQRAHDALKKRRMGHFLFTQKGMASFRRIAAQFRPCPSKRAITLFFKD